MLTDTFLNLNKIIETQGLEETASLLSEMAQNRPSFALDAGITQNDIWSRAENFRKCLALIENDDDRNALNNMIYFTSGIMPDYDSVENRFDAVTELENTINDFKSSDDKYASRLIGIGPFGIDHDWDSVEYDGRDHDYFDRQLIDDERNLFALQLTLAKKLNMPAVVHSRKGFNDTQDVLKTIKWNKGMIHGFSYTMNELEFFLDLGWYISFSGTVTYAGKKNFNDMAEIVAYVPKDRILLETDAPYYAPVPLKNTTNTPANISYIYEYVASKRGISSRKLTDLVDENFRRLFGIK